jgi:uncharacterized protein
VSSEVGSFLYLGVLVVAWLAIPAGVPGVLIMLGASLLYGWLTAFAALDARDLLWIAGIAVPAEAADQLLAIWAARRYGATLRGLVGSLVGGLLGSMLLSPVFPIVGTVVGALAGGFAGAYVVEWAVQKNSQRAFRAAWGGFVGRVAGILLKMVAGGWILYLAWHAVMGPAKGAS